MPGTSLWNSLRAFQLFGANTNVGKTIVSTALLKAIMAKNKVAPESACYIKPVSTGNIMEADTMHIQKYANGIDATCLYQFNDPVSPHLAAKKLGIIPENSKIVDLIRCFLAEKSNSILQTVQSQNCWVLVETAGGVLSPGPSGTVQADIYRPLRLPVVLIGDSNLGGISSTISSFESLCIRGFDVVALLTLENKKYQNHLYFEKYFKDKIAIIASIASPPPYPNNKCDNLDYKEMTRYYENIASGSAVTSVVRQLEHWHVQRIYKLKSLSKRAHKTIWYPFSQHKAISENTIATIDSAYGDFFEVLKPSSAPNNNVTTNMNSKDSLVVSSLDGSGSWWTQGLGHGNPNLALSAACAAGRYGHVILANTIHEPAMDLAETLLKTIKNPRLSRVFYSDNGSTAIEVAIKMALKASANRYKWDISKDSLAIIGLKRSYHGDTIGSMDCSEPSLYNQQINWYSNNGYWFDYPTVSYSDGKWTIKIPTTLKNTLGEDSKFETINQVFDFQNRDSLTYSKYIYKTIQTWVKNGAKFGAVLFEPVILGAGGMVFV